MRRYRLIEQVTFGPGTLLGLSEAQLARRRHVPVFEPEGGAHRTIAMVQFKAGEELGVDGDLPRSLSIKMQPLDAESQPEQAAAAAPKKPAAKSRSTV